MQHKLTLLQQGKKTAEEVITEFRLLCADAGYSAKTRTDHLHLIEKLQKILNPSLTKKILLDHPPKTINEWIERAIDIDVNYRNAMDIIGRYTRTGTSSGSSTGHKKRERRDPDAMDVDAMTTEK